MKKHGILLLLLSVTILTFLPCIHNGFVNWDDDLYVTGNPPIRSLSPRSLGRLFSNFYAANYQPVTMVSYALDYHFAGLDPASFHRTNLLIHLTNCILLYVFIWFLSRSVFVSFFAALLFGIHPLHVESVAWISARKDLLSCFFFLGALISYLFYLRKRVRSYYYLCLLAFFLSLLSKAMTLMLPFILLLCDYFINKKITKKDIIHKWPFFVLAVTFGILALYGQHRAGAIGEEYISAFLRHIGFACSAILFYLGKAFVPLNLSCFYCRSKMG